MRFFISGAAALNRDIAEWFHAAGILILEGYGLTETSAGTCVNRPDRLQVRHGRPAVRRAPSSRSPTTASCSSRAPASWTGYHNQDAATAEALADGWFHTGDIGEIDDDGFVRVTDRKKDLFKTSGGKYVAPQVIESLVQGRLPVRQPVRRASATSATS